MLPFTCLYESHCVHIFEINGHQFSSNSSIRISKEQLTLKSKFRFSSGVRFSGVKFAGVSFAGVRFAGMRFTNVRFFDVRFADMLFVIDATFEAAVADILKEVFLKLLARKQKF